MNEIDLSSIEIDEFESVPLPDKLPIMAPAPQDSHSLKSRTVQTLLNQNQDLMARLTIALKRNIELEQKVEVQEDNYQTIQAKFEALTDQSEIQSEKAKRMDYEINRMLDENSSLEKKFAELYTAYQDKITHIQNLSYRVHRFLKYKKKIRFLVRPFIQNLKFKIESLHHEGITLKEELLNKNEIIKNLEHKLQEAFEHIQTTTKNFEKDQAQLVEYHEKRFEELSNNFTSLQQTHETLGQKNDELKTSIQELKENEASMQNKSIYYERRFADLEAEHNNLLQISTNEKRADTQKIHMLEVQVQDLSTKYSETHAHRNRLQGENQNLTDQLQSIQLLYQDNYQKTEELKKVIDAQENMNKELSHALSEQRKRSDMVELKLFECEEEFKRKLQSFQMKFYKKPEEVAASTSSNSMNQKDLLDKIQSLLSEIQTGHPNDTETSQLISENGEIES